MWIRTLCPICAAHEQFSRATSGRNVWNAASPLTILAQITHPLAAANWGSALGRLLLQLAVIVLATRTVGALFRRAGLPAVVGEIAAGICLGPSVLGGFWPGAFGFIFAADSLGRLRWLSQVGVAVFMFLVGMELETGELPARGRSAALISQAGIVGPFLLGLGSAYFLYPEYAALGTRFVPFALFLGIALSITAFPVLVRILRERAMMKTPLGIMAVACAAAGDATAWAVLALIVALARAQGLGASLLNLGGLALFIVLMLGPVRRRLPGWLGSARWEGGRPGPAALAAVFIFAAAAALATEFLGIHALFGAFLAGAIMPRRMGFRESLAGLEKFTALVLLPLFFAFSGLRTHLGLLQDAGGWWICLALVVVATVGKIGSTLVAARWQGIGWADAFALGALMNTRGLMELIALNVGYDLGILPPRIFTAFVLMALVTTFLTGPLLDLGERLRRRA
jgi:Kef-type K+ transport system membrane component KefB